MKYLSRYFCLFLSSLLLLGLFSTSVSADSQSSVLYECEQITNYTITGGTSSSDYTYTFIPNNGVIQQYDYDIGSIAIPISNVPIIFNTRYNFTRLDGTSLISKGNKATINLFNICGIIDFYGNGSGVTYTNSNVGAVSVIIYYIDGTYITITPTKTINNGRLNLSFDIDTSKDIMSLSFTTRQSVTRNSILSIIENNSIYTVLRMGENIGDTSYSLNIDVESKEVGLLSRILNYIIDIPNAVYEMFRNILNSINDTLIDLPLKMWQKIENGLKLLFVPGEGAIQELYNEFDSLLQFKFGCIYQWHQLTIDAIEGIFLTDVQDSIYLPEITIPVGNGETFSFGGYNIKIIPDGFEVLEIACKTFVGFVSTFAFFNACRKRYDELMGVNNDN